MPSELSETNINDYVSTLLKYVIISFHLRIEAEWRIYASVN